MCHDVEDHDVEDHDVEDHDVEDHNIKDYNIETMMLKFSNYHSAIDLGLRVFYYCLASVYIFPTIRLR
jgi:hypothetical protein